MKKLLCVVGLVASFSAHAGGATLCPIYEFSELQTFSDKELGEAWYHNFRTIAKLTLPEAELKNCETQNVRINRIRDARQKAKTVEAGGARQQ